ncbi:hypothetical protein DRQ33_07305, partial [bacterium]
MKIVIQIIFWSGMITTIFGASISGFLTDQSNGEPLPYANVYLQGEPLGASTNDKGFYIIDGIEAGEHILIASYLGYAQWVDTIHISADEKIILDIQLEPSAEVGEAVIVETRREGGEMDLLTGHLIVSQKQVRQVPQLAEADLFRSMHLLPGVTPQSDFSSALYIWGGTPAQNLVTLDGIEVYNATHLGGAISSFNVDAIKEVNLIKGGFPAKWGGRIGSVLEIINLEGNRKKISGCGEISLLSTHATVHGPLPQFAGPGVWMLSFRRTYYDWITSLLKDADLVDFEFPYHFTDFHTKITRDFKGGDKFSVTYYHGEDIFDLTEDDQSDGDQLKFGWKNNTISANYNHLFSPKHFGHFMLAYSQFDDKLQSTDEGELSDFFEDYVKDFTARGVLSTAKGKHIFELGMEAKYLSILNKIEFPDYGEPIWDWKNEAGIISLYGQDEWKPNPLWKFEFGLRNELCTSGWYFRVSPRASIMRRIDEKTRIKFASGLYYQFFQAVPKFEEMGLSLFDTWVLAQKNLPPSWATHFVIRAETEKLWDVPLSLDFYVKKMENLYRHKELYTPDEEFASMFDKGDGWSSGADLMARINAKKWAGWISYSLGFTVNSFPSIDNNAPFYPKYDKRHSLSISLARDIGNGWTFTTAWNLSSGMPYTEPLGYFYAPNFYYGSFDPSWWVPFWYYGGYHNKRVPTYHRLDVSIAKRANFSWIDIEAYFQIINLYNRKNI